MSRTIPAWRTTLAAGVLAAALIAPAVPASAAATDRPDTGVDGIPALTDEHGRALTLRGWNVGDKAHSGDAALSGVTERHFRDMRAKGFNFARLLVFWDDLEPRPGQYSQSYLRKIERVLDWAEKHDVKVLLDAHQDVFGPAFGHRGVAGLGHQDRRTALHSAPRRLVLRVLRARRAARLHPPVRGRGPPAGPGPDVAAARRPLRGPPGRPRLRPDQRADG